MPGYDGRRYLADFHYKRVSHLLTDVLVIGAGVAGLRAAIEAARYGQVLVLCKAPCEEASTPMAQGGVAVALDPQDDPAGHVADTLRVGCGLCNRRAVERMVYGGPDCIRELIDWGAQFDRDGERFLKGLEGGHQRPRILHCRGDATGAEIARTLLAKAHENPNIRIVENCFAVDLLTDEGRCVGVVAYHPTYGLQLLWARQTILASGGVGRIYRETTNSIVATGDGHAMAFRAGAVLRGMEMVQFHPTTLYIAGATRALISEAVRGEGAYLVDKSGYRFMPDYHPDAELAPRDVVSRAIVDRMVKTGSTHVYLDVRHIEPERFRRRFPHITRICEQFGIDVSRDLIPVRPAAHYMIGGIAVDLDGRSSLEGLLAAGEVANTGVHGANRLASNSLLEGLVFGKAAGAAAGMALEETPELTGPKPLSHVQPRSGRGSLDLVDVANSLKSAMWRNVGIRRNAEGLMEALASLDFWGRYVMDKTFTAPAAWEVQNMLTVGRLIARAALERTESRGVHFRADFPDTNDAAWRRNILLRRGEDGLEVWTEPVE